MPRMVAGSDLVLKLINDMVNVVGSPNRGVSGESVEAITGVKTSPEAPASAAAAVAAIVAKEKMAKRTSPKIFIGKISAG